MPKYTVLRREVHISHQEIEADSVEDAINRVVDGEGDEVYFEYSHTLDSDIWSVEDANGKRLKD